MKIREIAYVRFVRTGGTGPDFFDIPGYLLQADGAASYVRYANGFEVWHFDGTGFTRKDEERTAQERGSFRRMSPRIIGFRKHYTSGRRSPVQIYVKAEGDELAYTELEGGAIIRAESDDEIVFGAHTAAEYTGYEVIRDFSRGINDRGFAVYEFRRRKNDLRSACWEDLNIPRLFFLREMNLLRER